MTAKEAARRVYDERPLVDSGGLALAAADAAGEAHADPPGRHIYVDVALATDLAAAGAAGAATRDVVRGAATRIPGGGHVR